MRGVNTTKLLILAILGFCALILGSAVLTLQLYVKEENIKLGRLGNNLSSRTTRSRSRSSTGRRGTNPPTQATSGGENNSNGPLDTIKSAKPISSQDIRLSSSHPPPQGRSVRLVQDAYWRQAATALKDWDVLFQDEEDDATTTTSASVGGKGATTSSHLVQFALTRAAETGHALAQHYLANAYASGIWPVKERDDDDGVERVVPSLYVSDEWSPTIPPTTDSPHGDHQLNQAFVLWHMAAMGGNIEASISLAHRLALLDDGPSSSSSACSALPYLEAAANGIMDELEASPHSRAKIIPPMDQHILAHVHMHGGTSSQLDVHNKPYESKEAIQFYHIKATTIPWNTRLTSGNNNNNKADTSNQDSSIDLQAAYTLALFYHHGQRGVPQNLTQSLLYYEIAANQRHWESAGVAGTFYLWGMGTEQNVELALKYFKIGAPYELELCLRIHEQVLNSDLETTECDAASLNGLGVLHLLGVENTVEVDLAKAQKYFALAKELGNADAMYHLAMMWLGWKTHFKYVHELKDDGVSRDPYNANLEEQKKDAPTFALLYSERTDKHQKGPTQGEIQEAVKLLLSAANKNHVQAKHRLAMIYSQGVSIQASTLKYDAIKPSCSNAMVHYQWIVDNASLQRSKRLRAAYQAYMDGDLDVSLRNYLAAAETGSDVGQVNAAFLLERGTCLGLSSMDCAKASVRLWKAASSKGHNEACLRVGDFYYYGRLRESTAPVGPFGWFQYLLYPEEHLPGLLSEWYRRARWILAKYLDVVEDGTIVESTNQLSPEEIQHQQEILEADLSMAAHYYKEGAEKHRSPRANFNLGFMYEFGLGLKQDFPLAKRHYDLARTMSIRGEAEVAVQISLWVMSVHEYIVKWKLSWEDRQRRQSRPPSNASHPHRVGRTKQDVILSHIFNWSSLLIVVLLYLFVQLQKARGQRRRT